MPPLSSVALTISINCGSTRGRRRRHGTGAALNGRVLTHRLGTTLLTGDQARRIKRGCRMGEINVRFWGKADMPQCPLFHRKRTLELSRVMFALCHVWTAPSWQGKSARLQPWSVQPCVRPVCAVHMTAGHNALRGSGPGQKAAFEDAVAQVGCPDRRIDGSALRAVRPPNLHITPGD